MLLEISDLKEIGKIVDKSVNKAVDQAKKELRAEIKASGEDIKKELRGEIKQSGESIKSELRGEIQETVTNSEKRIISIISGEVQDLAEINYAVITKVDQLDHRLNVVENKLGLRTK